MIDLNTLSVDLSLKSNHRKEEWHSLLNATIHDPAFSQMTDGEIKHLVMALISPDQLKWLLDVFRNSYMRRTDEMPFDFLAKNVNQSAYTLQEWLEVLQFISENKDATTHDLDTLIASAKECLEKSPAQPVPPPFLEIVRGQLVSK